jgi:hypothetical protein
LLIGWEISAGAESCQIGFIAGRCGKCEVSLKQQLHAGQLTAYSGPRCQRQLHEDGGNWPTVGQPLQLCAVAVQQQGGRVHILQQPFVAQHDFNRLAQRGAAHGRESQHAVIAGLTLAPTRSGRSASPVRAMACWYSPSQHSEEICSLALRAGAIALACALPVRRR